MPVICGIAMFDWINGNALYRFLHGKADRFQATFYEQFMLAHFSDRPTIVLVVHSTAFAVVIMAILSRGFIQSRARSR